MQDRQKQTLHAFKSQLLEQMQGALDQFIQNQTESMNATVSQMNQELDKCHQGKEITRRAI